MLTHFLFLNGPINFSLLVANCRGINEKGSAILKNTCENTSNCSILDSLPRKITRHSKTGMTAKLLVTKRLIQFGIESFKNPSITI